MRLKYYLLTLRQMNFNKSFVFFFIVFLVTLIISTSIYNKSLKPTLETLSKENAKVIALKSSNEATKEAIENISYEDLVTINKDNSGKITTITSNVSKMNQISNMAILSTQERIEKSDSNIRVPIGAFIGLNIFSGEGVKVKIKTLPTGVCKANFKSSFDKAGINQTRHKITLIITVEVSTVAPFFTEVEEYVNEIPIAETVIVGDIPNTYYDINGVNNLETKDTLDMIDSNN